MNVIMEENYLKWNDPMKIFGLEVKQTWNKMHDFSVI